MNKQTFVAALLLAASLNIAVAKSKDFFSSEVKALATAIHHEARGESLAGKKAVANAIMNRVRHKEFPNTVAAVIA